jgi:cobyric acid synthase
VGGLGLLPLHTTMALGKTLTRAGAKHLPSGLPLRGYEIHHGQTDCLRAQPVVRREDGEVLGAGLPGGLVWGTYLHGTFDTDEFRRWFVDRLRVRKGLKPLGQIAARYDLEPALDRLADVVRHSVKMDAIYKLLGVR